MLEKFNKFLNSSIVLSVLMFILGLIFMIYPSVSFSVVTYIIAIFLILNGLYFIIEKDNSTAWNVGIGANVSILDMLNADVGIRHVELGKMRFDNRSSKLSFEEIYAGIRFGF